MNFSFLYFDTASQLFTVNDCEPNYLGKFTERLKALSQITPAQARNQQSSTLHFDKIRWEGTPVSEFGFPKEEEIAGDEAWEFEITRNAHGRVHGFFIDETFYIVWIDPKHKLCP